MIASEKRFRILCKDIDLRSKVALYKLQLKSDSPYMPREIPDGGSLIGDVRSAFDEMMSDFHKAIERFRPAVQRACGHVSNFAHCVACVEKSINEFEAIKLRSKL